MEHIEALACVFEFPAVRGPEVTNAENSHTEGVVCKARAVEVAVLFTART